MNSRSSSPRANTVMAKNGGSPCWSLRSGARRHGGERVRARAVGGRAAPAGEGVAVAAQRARPLDDQPVGVGLPELEERVGDRLAGPVEHPPVQPDRARAAGRHQGRVAVVLRDRSAKNGPTVWPGVGGRRHVLLLEGRGRRAGEHDVPAVAGAPLGLGDVVVVGRHQPLAGLRVDDRLVDRVEGEQRVAGEVHLGDQPLGEVGAEQREVDVRRPPGVVVVAPRVRARLDGRERVAAVVVGEAAADADEVRVERRRVLVALVDVAPGRVGLPDLDELVAYRPAVAVEDAPGHLHPLADRLAAVLDGQVGLERPDVALAEDRRSTARRPRGRPGRGSWSGGAAGCERYGG